MNAENSTHSETPYPIRKNLNHAAPLGIDATSAFYFVTVCAADRDAAPFLSLASEILDSVRYRHNAGIWFVSLFLIMPDHIHMLVHVPSGGGQGLPALPSVGADSSVGRARRPSAPCGGDGGRAARPLAAATDFTTNNSLVDGCGGQGPARPTGACGLAAVIAAWKHYLSRRYGLAFQRDFFDTRIRDDAHYAEKWNYIVRNPVTRGLVASPRDWPHVIAFDRATGLERPHR